MKFVCRGTICDGVEYTGRMWDGMLNWDGNDALKLIGKQGREEGLVGRKRGDGMQS